MGWEQLASMFRENRLEAEREAAAPPVVCPVDGAILNINPYGVRSCPLGNYTLGGVVPAQSTSV